MKHDKDEIIMTTSKLELSKQQLEFNENLLNLVLNGKTNLSFDDACHVYESVYKTIFKKEDFMLSMCTCEEYLKQNCCSHIIGLALRLRLTEAPYKAQTTPLGQKRSRGRNAKAKPALVRQ